MNKTFEELNNRVLINDTIMTITRITELLQRTTDCLEIEQAKRKEMESRIDLLQACVIELKEENVRLKNIINDKL